MIVPNAEQIESAADDFGARGSDAVLNEKILNEQAKELVSAIGAGKASDLGLTFPLNADAQLGYALGLQTARKVIAGSTELMLKGADPKKVL